MTSEEVYKKVVEVEKLIAGLLKQIEQNSKALDALNEAREEDRDARLKCEKDLVAVCKDIDEFRRWMLKNGTSDLEKEVAVLKAEVAELKKGKDVWGQRIFTAVLALVIGILGAVLGSLLKKP